MFSKKAPCEVNACKHKATGTEIVSATGTPLLTAVSTCGVHAQEIQSGQKVRVLIDGQHYDARQA
ncbi:hypothetical protein HZZ00_37310 (plasmid) [Streptomyces sp. NEAU-sy36]|uniref:hypothetical protein n=1 Tax=unclassified Streptomyces TaxID=2593676 RepID=UPI0015D585BA|nr:MULTISPECIES: hypothetical protein [unclassified Streptomyces]QLJ06693.1 hypothetical protein HZZ00_37310 [Streptomyces sp. NEAU-sy36]